jgi:hypothetical protein
MVMRGRSHWLDLHNRRASQRSIRT